MHSDQKQEIRVHIRWMIRGDMPEVLAIEKECFEYPWSEDDFVNCLRQGNCIGMVAEHDDRVVGFMIYELHKTRIHVLNFVVAKDCQRQGVGRQMIAKLSGNSPHMPQPDRAGSARYESFLAIVFPRERLSRGIGVAQLLRLIRPKTPTLCSTCYRPEKVPAGKSQPHNAVGRIGISFAIHANSTQARTKKRVVFWLALSG